MSRSAAPAGAAVLAAVTLLGCGLTRSPGAPSSAKRTLSELEEILLSHNDNDPRLDRDFFELSRETKRLFRIKYGELAAEKRNERGTIVYVLGRNLTSPEDWEFLRTVAAEPACLSLADCSRASSESGESGDDVTLAYPSLVALRQAHRAAAEGGSLSEARGVLAAAKASPMRAVKRLAASLESQFARIAE
ncbi:MAG: hypothetical protein COV48_04205 [Elusimicrobia bacterium CG11_big_fil_rev_8_21_14_0_20_64_6]|nr:MAG: hypothetical protein COV48_04205 [Elusimicrobia bacterium CG11_big_fil_rev_8_21_14_0_20_64_6]